MIVPDWPTNIAYFSTTPDEETSFYNALYAPGGKFPFWPSALTYPQVVSAETDIALSHLTSGSVYTHTFHIANLRDYGGGKTLRDGIGMAGITSAGRFGSDSRDFARDGHSQGAQTQHRQDRPVPQ